MGLSAIAIAGLVTAATSAASAAYSIKRGEAQKGEAAHAKKKAKSEAQKRKEKLAREKEKSPGQRLLGGRPTLG